MMCQCVASFTLYYYRCVTSFTHYHYRWCIFSFILYHYKWCVNVSPSLPFTIIDDMSCVTSFTLYHYKWCVTSFTLYHYRWCVTCCGYLLTTVRCRQSPLLRAAVADASCGCWGSVAAAAAAAGGRYRPVLGHCGCSLQIWKECFRFELC